MIDAAGAPPWGGSEAEARADMQRRAEAAAEGLRRWAAGDRSEDHVHAAHEFCHLAGMVGAERPAALANGAGEVFEEGRAAGGGGFTERAP